MDRRTAMFLTLLGGLIPRGLLAQSAGRRTAARSRPRGTTLEPVRNSSRARDDEPLPDEAEPSEDTLGSDFPPEPGQQWRIFDISGYTSLAHSQNNPQNAIIDWIFRRTQTAPWHGDKLAALFATRTQLRAYNSAKILSQVSEVVDRFTKSVDNILSIHVKFVAANDTRWRHAVWSRLTTVGSGPQGQQVWTLRAEDSQFVLDQMLIYQGCKVLTNKAVEMVNGQTLVIKTSESRGYSGSLQRESAAGLGFQPRAEQIEEGVTLRFSPLLTRDGDMVDAAIDLTANTVKSFHRTRVIAPREVGPSEVTLDVPEVTETRLNQTVKSWPLGNTLLISAGIHPGILQSKAGLFNLRIPGTVPTGTELLVFIEAKIVEPPRSARERDD